MIRSVPAATPLHAACQRPQLRAGVNVVIEMHSVRDAEEVLVTTPALSLPAETLRRLAALDLWLDVDQYVY
ncbi:hypothetical protein [Micromonospora sp. NPDC050200]|uniref:hypothetical protein n=1 Tax=Micromonospora sp. NPDC050200 TaxID=3155664 RepID=UPI00340CFE58